MYIEIVSTDPPALELRDAGNFNQFHVLMPVGLKTGIVPTLLSATGAGEFNGDGHAYINTAWLMSQVPNEAEWVAGFEDMLAYAHSKDWLNEARTAIRAHLQPT